MPTKREQFVQTIRAQYLGEQMRKLREDRGLTLKYIAAHLGVEFSTLARYERAEWPFRRDHVIAMLDVYGVYNEVKRSQLIDLAQTAWQINQWEPVGSRYDSLLPADGKGFLPIDPWWLQAKAEELCIYAPLVVPDVSALSQFPQRGVIRSRNSSSVCSSWTMRALVMFVEGIANVRL